jgi:hypothetical protein
MADVTEIKAKNPGILEVPEDKDFYQMPLNHYINLAKRKGAAAIMRALLNLERWNKNRAPKVSKQARDIINKLKGNSQWQAVKKGGKTEALLMSREASFSKDERVIVNKVLDVLNLMRKTILRNAEVADLTDVAKETSDYLEWTNLLFEKLDSSLSIIITEGHQNFMSQLDEIGQSLEVMSSGGLPHSVARNFDSVVNELEENLGRVEDMERKQKEDSAAKKFMDGVSANMEIRFVDNTEAFAGIEVSEDLYTFASDFYLEQRPDEETFVNQVSQEFEGTDETQLRQLFGGFRDLEENFLKELSDA